MTSNIELERLVRPSDRPRHRSHRRRRGVFGSIADVVVAAINAIIT